MRGAAAALSASAALMAAAPAQAGTQPPEPTLAQVEQAAQAGRVDAARRMIEQVLREHPGSARAHWVDAELLAAQGLFGPARDELAAARAIAPGLPFVSRAAADALRARLDRLSAPAASRLHDDAARPPDRARSLAWALPLAIAAGGIVAWLLMRLGLRPASPPACRNGTPRRAR